MLGTLRAELRDDPLARDYASKTPKEIMQLLRLKDRPRVDTVIPAEDILQQVDLTELMALNANETRHFYGVLHLGSLDLSRKPYALLRRIFGAQSVTMTGIDALMSKPDSRLDELGLTNVKISDVKRVAAEIWPLRT